MPRRSPIEDPSTRQRNSLDYSYDLWGRRRHMRFAAAEDRVVIPVIVYFEFIGRIRASRNLSGPVRTCSTYRVLLKIS
jgi:hypothetical protein